MRASPTDHVVPSYYSETTAPQYWVRRQCGGLPLWDLRRLQLPSFSILYRMALQALLAELQQLIGVNDHTISLLVRFGHAQKAQTNRCFLSGCQITKVNLHPRTPWHSAVRNPRAISQVTR
ncbi:MAG: hypothetical protein ACJATT_002408 [Myxococcota bacterium]|jgi:hypothetical protein